MEPPIGFYTVNPFLMLLFLIVPSLGFSNDHYPFNLQYTHNIWTFFDHHPSSFIERLLDYSRSVVTPDYNLTFLQPDNLTTVLDTSLFPKTYMQLIPQHKADFLRVLLLAVYGGWWIDASTIIASKSYIDKIVRNAQKNSVDYVLYCSKACPRKYLENGVMYAPQGSKCAASWHKENLRILDIGIRNYVYLVNRDGVSAPPGVFRPYPQVRIYLGFFMAIQRVIEREIPRRTPLTIMRAPKHIFKLFYDCHWDSSCYVPIAKNMTRLRNYPITKFPSRARKRIEPRNTFIPRNITDIKPLIYSNLPSSMNQKLYQVTFYFSLTVNLQILLLLPTIRSLLSSFFR